MSMMKKFRTALALSAALATTAPAIAQVNNVQDATPNEIVCQGAELVSGPTPIGNWGIDFVCQNGTGYIHLTGVNKPDGAPVPEFYELNREDAGGSNIRAWLGNAYVDQESPGIVRGEFPMGNPLGLFSDDFESGHLGKWSAIRNSFMSVQTVPPRCYDANTNEKLQPDSVTLTGGHTLDVVCRGYHLQLTNKPDGLPAEFFEAYKVNWQDPTGVRFELLGGIGMDDVTNFVNSADEGVTFPHEETYLP